MKYFMSVFSPARDARRVFLMNRVTAEYYYGDFLRKFSDVHRERCFEEGTVVRAAGNRDLFIWGGEMSDAELFRLRLCGRIDKDELHNPL